MSETRKDHETGEVVNFGERWLQREIDSAYDLFYLRVALLYHMSAYTIEAFCGYRVVEYDGSTIIESVNTEDWVDAFRRRDEVIGRILNEIEVRKQLGGR